LGAPFGCRVFCNTEPSTHTLALSLALPHCESGTESGLSCRQQREGAKARARRHAMASQVMARLCICACVGGGMTMITGCKLKKKDPNSPSKISTQLQDITNVFQEVLAGRWWAPENVIISRQNGGWGKALLDKDKRRAGTLKIIIEARTLGPRSTYVDIYIIFIYILGATLFLNYQRKK